VATRSRAKSNSGSKQGTESDSGSKQGTKASSGGSRQGTKSSGSSEQGTKSSGTSRRSTKSSGTSEQGTKSSGGSRRSTKSSGTSRQNTKGSGTSRQGAKTSGGSRQQRSRRSTGSDNREKATYVYGILPADIELTDEMTGVGDPPGTLRVVRHDDLVALVSDVNPSGRLGTPDDLTAHKEILDACAEDLPVLPLRFGAVLTDDDAVASELLADHHDEFAEALRQLDGQVQYIIKGRYDERAILEEVLSEDEQAAQLREQIRGQDADATREARMALGEIINNAISAKREQDTRKLGEMMDGHAAASVAREPSHERDAVDVAFLLDADQQEQLQKVVDKLAKNWKGRIELRVLGPMAAYDFVATAQPGG
jgi:hypothetical protein